ncbi:hypothetical protein TRVL_04684 [Trypanosoma vivax]|nr:hypothetical protein TRVL_04684 [Trypanosoma vivax]
MVRSLWLSTCPCTTLQACVSILSLRSTNQESRSSQRYFIGEYRAVLSTVTGVKIVQRARLHSTAGVKIASAKRFCETPLEVFMRIERLHSGMFFANFHSVVS